MGAGPFITNTEQYKTRFIQVIKTIELDPPCF